MLSPASRRRWLAWALLLAAPMAAAQSPQCGLFKAEEGSSTLRISSPNRGEQRHFGSAPSPVAFQQIDGKLQLVSLEYGLPSALQVRDRGRTVEVDGTVFALQAPAQCAAAAVPAEGSCLANAAACLDNRYEATPIDRVQGGFVGDARFAQAVDQAVTHALRGHADTDGFRLQAQAWAHAGWSSAALRPPTQLATFSSAW